MTKTTRHTISTACSIVLFLLLNRPVLAQSEASVAPLFASHDVLSVRIEAPMTTLLKVRPDEEYLDGKFHYVGADGAETSLDLKLQTRGITRRKREICNFPPIRLNFRKKQVEDTVFDGQDKLKLVTHCQANKASFEQLILREYLGYRILQAMTDRSFSSRLMRITYVDNEKKGKSVEKYGFVIEDEDNLGERLGMTAAKVPGIDVQELDRQHANLVSVFEYLIGNTDFSLILGPSGKSCCHNSVLYSKGAPPYSAIPYDFDYSGLVNAPYAAPNPRFKLRNVKQRLYRGRCMNNDLLDATFAQYIEKEPEFRSLVDNIEGFNDRTRKDLHNYLNTFYKDISNPKSKDRRFVRNCS